VHIRVVIVATATVVVLVQAERAYDGGGGGGGRGGGGGNIVRGGEAGCAQSNRKWSTPLSAQASIFLAITVGSLPISYPHRGTLGSTCPGKRGWAPCAEGGGGRHMSEHGVIEYMLSHSLALLSIWYILVWPQQGAHACMRARAAAHGSMAIGPTACQESCDVRVAINPSS
jgi:hypothetical protein